MLEIASLKRVGKGTKLLILDSNGGGAKDVAKGLSARGFRNVFVVQGGYSGWTSSKLQTKNSSSVRAHRPCSTCMSCCECTHPGIAEPSGGCPGVCLVLPQWWLSVISAIAQCSSLCCKAGVAGLMAGGCMQVSDVQILGPLFGGTGKSNNGQVSVT